VCCRSLTAPGFAYFGCACAHVGRQAFAQVVLVKHQTLRTCRDVFTRDCPALLFMNGYGFTPFASRYSFSFKSASLVGSRALSNRRNTVRWNLVQPYSDCLSSPCSRFDAYHLAKEVSQLLVHEAWDGSACHADFRQEIHREATCNVNSNLGGQYAPESTPSCSVSL